MLVRRYEYKARQTAYLITRQKELAEDIAQEAFIQCFNQLGSLRQPEYFQTWFYRILIRTSFRLLRKEKWRSFFLLQKETFVAKQEPDIAEKIETEETRQVLHEIVNQLNEKLRTVIVLYYFNELTISEISTVIAISEGTVKSRLHHARKQMFKKLKAKGYIPNSLAMEANSDVGSVFERHLTGKS